MKNCYKGLIEDWMFELIRNRAYRWKVNKNNIEDVMQECVMELINFKFDEEKSSGSRLKTVYTTIIDRKIFSTLRSDINYRRHSEAFQKQFKEDCDEGVCFKEIDLADSLENLTDREKEVCNLVVQGYSKNQIAEILGHSWATVDLSFRKAMKKINMKEEDDQAPFFNR